MNINDKVQIKIGSTIKTGTIQGIEDDVLIISLGENNIITIARIALGDEPYSYEISVKDAEGKRLLME